MLIKTYSKTVFKNKSGGHQMNFPKDVYDRLGQEYTLDFYSDKVVMYPVKNLGENKED